HQEGFKESRIHSQPKVSSKETIVYSEFHMANATEVFIGFAMPQSGSRGDRFRHPSKARHETSPSRIPATGRGRCRAALRLGAGLSDPPSAHDRWLGRW